jgi:IPT/TIG domain
MTRSDDHSDREGRISMKTRGFDRIRPAVALAAGVAGLLLAGAAYGATIANVTPNYGIPQLSGQCNGTHITITGSGFVNDGGTVSVSFNGVPALGLVVGSDTTLYVVVPGTATTGPVSVTTGAGTVSTTTPFTVSPCQDAQSTYLKQAAPTKTTTTAKKKEPVCKKGQKSTKAKPCTKKK